VPSGAPFGTPGSDRYDGDPVVVVDKSARKFTVGGTATAQAAGEFYYASIYQLPDGTQSLSVNRGQFQRLPPQTTESVATTRCAKDPSQFGMYNTQNLPSERIVWERPVVAVPVTNSSDFLDKGVALRQPGKRRAICELHALRRGRFNPARAGALLRWSGPDQNSTISTFGKIPMRPKEFSFKFRGAKRRPRRVLSLPRC
jgi:hypothetical protein